MSNHEQPQPLLIKRLSRRDVLKIAGTAAVLVSGGAAIVAGVEYLSTPTKMTVAEVLAQQKELYKANTYIEIDNAFVLPTSVQTVGWYDYKYMNDYPTPDYGGVSEAWNRLTCFLNIYVDPVRQPNKILQGTEGLTVDEPDYPDDNNLPIPPYNITYENDSININLDPTKIKRFTIKGHIFDFGDPSNTDLYEPMELGYYFKVDEAKPTG